MGGVAYLVHFALGFMLINNELPLTTGLLYPKESETREVRNLDGIWNFAKSDESNPNLGVRDKWYNDDLSKFRPTIPMPVPASYNDITENAEIRDHVGTVWYDRKFFTPKTWENQRVWIRFGSVHYAAYVWINGVKVADHEIGHLPFGAEITNNVIYGGENRITVLCDNVLLDTTIPQGKISEKPTDTGVTIIQSYTFDFFNYAGIQRSVHIYTTPKIYIKDVDINTDLSDTKGFVYYKIYQEGATNENDIYVQVKLRDKEGNIVGSKNSSVSSDLKGVLEIENVKPWWPFLMHPEPGYLYTIEIYLHETQTENLIDVYRLKVGIRTLKWDTTTFLINGKPIYFRGFGKHEDSDIRGKGLDLPILTKDFNLLKWIGANAYRTSHYPYSEESMDFADEQGIMIIDECPSVDTDIFSQALLDNHKSSMEQLIHRDKNHPSVIMWSIANEPRTAALKADQYFEYVANFTRSLDKTRPVTAAIAVNFNQDKAGKHLDIISFNHYNGWYANNGRLDMITNDLITYGTGWFKKYNKPVIMTEYGADTIAGFHSLPTVSWTEEYQERLLAKHFKAFDVLRQKGFFIGEFLWNFADFQTGQGTTRVVGNKKGIFTRNRQPKSAAHLLRKRYYLLAHEMEHYSYPDDLFLYISDSIYSYRDSSEL